MKSQNLFFYLLVCKKKNRDTKMEVDFHGLLISLEKKTEVVILIYILQILDNFFFFLLKINILIYDISKIFGIL